MRKEETQVAEEITDDITDVSLLDIPVLIVFVLLFITVGLQFFTRYVLNDSLGWTEEIARYFLILLGFVGAITCVRKGRHISLAFAYHYLPTRIIKPCIVIREIVVSGFWGYCCWYAIELAERTHSQMVSIALPKAIIYYIVSASCFLMTLFTVLALPALLKKTPERVADEALKTGSQGL